MVTAQVGVFPVMGRVVLQRLDAQQPVVLGTDYPALSRLSRTVFLMVIFVTRRLEPTTWIEMLLHTADKTFQGMDEGFDHAANPKSVSGLTSMIPGFQALSTAIYQKFERMSKVAITAFNW